MRKIKEMRAFFLLTVLLTLFLSITIVTSNEETKDELEI